MQVNIFEARNRLSRLIKAANEGEPVVIANRGVPVARLVAAEATSASCGKNGRALLDWLSTHPLPAHLQRTAEQIDAGIREQREDGWD